MDDAKTVWVGNIADQVTEELLYELFLQSGPLERVKIPTDRDGRKSSFAFVTFKHEVSVPYAVQLLNGIKLCEKNLNIKPRNGGAQKEKYNALQSPMQRSFSYPNEAYNSPHNEQRFDEPNIGPQHISFEDLLRMGPMMNVNHAYQDTNFDNDDFGNNFGHNKYQPERSSFRDRDRGRDRKDYNESRNDRDRDRRHDFSNNSRRNNNKRSNFDRSGGRRNHRYY